MTDDFKNKSILKIYTDVESSLIGPDKFAALNSDKLLRAMREIAAYCTFNGIDLDFIPKMSQYGNIEKIGVDFVSKYGKPIKNPYEKMANNPYIITDIADGEQLRTVLKNYQTTSVDLKQVLIKIIEHLKQLNENFTFSHEDFHPENIYIQNNPLKVTFIDFDLAEFGDKNYGDNIIPVDRPFSRRLTSCVPSVLNDTLNEIVDQGRLGELRRAIKCDKNTKLDRVAVIYYIYMITFLTNDATFKDFIKVYKDLFDQINSAITNVEFYENAIKLCNKLSPVVSGLSPTTVAPSTVAPSTVAPTVASTVAPTVAPSAVAPTVGPAIVAPTVVVPRPLVGIPTPLTAIPLTTVSSKKAPLVGIPIPSSSSTNPVTTVSTNPVTTVSTNPVTTVSTNPVTNPLIDRYKTILKTLTQDESAKKLTALLNTLNKSSVAPLPSPSPSPPKNNDYEIKNAVRGLQLLNSEALYSSIYRSAYELKLIEKISMCIGYNLEDYNESEYHEYNESPFITRFTAKVGEIITANPDNIVEDTFTKVRPDTPILDNGKPTLAFKNFKNRKTSESKFAHKIDESEILFVTYILQQCNIELKIIDKIEQIKREPNEIYIYKGDDYKFISFNDSTVKFIEQFGGNRKRKMLKRKTLKIKTRKKSKSHSTPLLDEKIHHKKNKNSARNKH